jgi:hypothetical protein
MEEQLRRWPPRRSTKRWDDMWVKVNITEICFEDGRWMWLVQGRVHGRPVCTPVLVVWFCCRRECSDLFPNSRCYITEACLYETWVVRLPGRLSCSFIVHCHVWTWPSTQRNESFTELNSTTQRIVKSFIQSVRPVYTYSSSYNFELFFPYIS